MKRGSWHGEARELRAQGWTLRKIAARFGVTYQAVQYATSEQRRANVIATSAAWNKANPARYKQIRANGWARRFERRMAVAREYGAKL